MAKLPLTKLRALLKPGTEFTAEFIGVNVHHCLPGMEKTRRRVLINNSREMRSQFLDGPKQNEAIWLDWKFCTADQREDKTIVLINTESTPPEEFLRITL